MKSDLNEYFTKIITNEKRRRMRSGVASEVSKREAIRKGLHRIPSKSEIQPAVQPLHHYIFCTHNVPYWRTCTKCGRDKELAARNAEMILSRCGNLADSLK